jgi:hypothetical protein
MNKDDSEHTSTAARGEMRSLQIDVRIYPEPRYGYGKPGYPLLMERIANHVPVYHETVADIIRFAPYLRNMQFHEDPVEPWKPFWINGFLPGLDVAALY